MRKKRRFIGTWNFVREIPPQQDPAIVLDTELNQGKSKTLPANAEWACVWTYTKSEAKRAIRKELALRLLEQLEEEEN
jgi:hypothetical protein